MHDAISRLAESLLAWFESCPGAVIAFSGGVDSAVVCRAAHQALGNRALAVIADSPSLARHELEAAERLAHGIGIELRILQTQELDDPAYQVNDAQRCFHCKTHLFTGLETLPEVQRNHWWVLTGSNSDDMGDWRPGLKAASQHSVRSPLLELGIGKEQVRELARLWDLPVADKPASPCLASRLAYGLNVTPERLSMVERAEAELRQLGLTQFRVRLHADDLARIEVPLTELPRLIEPQTRAQLVKSFAAIGFRYVSLDLEGFASGSLNKIILPNLN
jgi:uncharacterized protein